MKILLLNQCFYPDVASTAQHLADLAVELVENGHEVTVVASDRGYDDSSVRFSRRETWKGVNIIRIPSLALGKSAKWRRVVNFASYMFVCALRLLFLPRFDAVLALTSPPLISVLGSLFVSLKGGRLIFWVMDLNPDEAIAAGWLRESSLLTKMLSAFLRYSLRHAERIIVLDRFMKERIIAKGIAEEKIEIIPPWSHTDAVSFDQAGREAFRRAHGLSDKFVVMYSGNHSPCHSLETLLEAAAQLAANDRVRFCFVGGGSAYQSVKDYAQENKLTNILCLPYQPLNQLSASLSAADLHAVVLGDSFRGIVHPCKIYNILEIAAPVLYIGPATSHVIDVVAKLEDQSSLCSVRHGDVATLRDYIATRAQDEAGKRNTSAAALASSFSPDALLPEMLRVIECAPGQQFKSRAVVSDTKEQWLS
ncbi:MAG TPA: glycosyltransferase family 4 protein [Pyrinomonadaceae bacterium]|nr:glycosyltransferase family 4 protein [Pyrinomonadaceae bacterium]